MRKISWIFLFLLSAICPSKAQDPIDSIQRLIDKSSRSLRADLQRSLCFAYLSSDADRALRAAQDFLQRAKAENMAELQDSAYELLGDLYSQLHQSSNALRNYQQALVLTKINKESDRAGELLFKMGQEEEFELLQYDQAIIHYQEGLFRLPSKPDPILKSNLLSGLGNCYRKKNEYTKAGEFYFQALTLLKEDRDDEAMYKLFNRIGLNFNAQRKIRESIEWYMKSLVLQQKRKNLQGEAISYLNLGNAYLDLEDYQQSLENFQSGIRLFDSIGDQQGMANCLNGIGIIYDHQHLYDQALGAYQQSLKINQVLENESDAAMNLQNMGIIHSLRMEQKMNQLYGPDWKDQLENPLPDSIFADLKKSMDYQEAALEIRQRLNDSLGIASSNLNLGPLYLYQHQNRKARQCFNIAAGIYEQYGNTFDFVLSILGLGQTELQTGNIDRAIVHFRRSLDLAEKNLQKEPLAESYLGLSRAWEKKGDAKRALDFYKKYNDLQETLLVAKSRKDLTELQVKYDTEKKEQEIVVLNKDNELKASRLKQQRYTIFFILVGLALLSVALWQTVRQVRLKRRANKVLEEKNELITRQHEEITKSIDAACIIQKAALMPDEQIREMLPYHFIFFRPRDIVSGDYYWFYQLEKKVIAVVADCTGHGVPGALTSMLGISFLNQVVAQRNILHPDLILGEMRTLVVESLHQAGMDEGQKAGMDMAVLLLDFANRKIEYAGAKNPLIIIKKGELLEIDADRTGVGMAWGEEKPYTPHHFDMDPGDHYYIFSDGLADQFGGEKGKKYMSKNLKKTLLELSVLPINAQLTQLENVMDSWRGKFVNEEGIEEFRYEQVDDNLLVGIRIE